MQTEHVILCGGLAPGRDVDPEARVLPLNLWSGKPEENNVVLRIEDLHERLWKPVPTAFEDLLEIAAYVYCADQATSRGQMDVDTFGAKWRRRFRLHIPVRIPELWNSEEVKRTLCGTLGEQCGLPPRRARVAGMDVRGGHGHAADPRQQHESAGRENSLQAGARCGFRSIGHSSED